MDLSSPSQPVQLVMIWDPIFILFSYLLCVQASYSTVTILQQRFNWWMNCLAAGCFSICGIWAMHFIGMKACDLGVPVVFDGAITMLSMLPAFVLVLIAFALMRTKVTMSDPNATSCEAHLNAMKAAAHHWILLSAILIAAGVCAMHYIGMAAMHIQAVTVSLHWPTIIASAVVAFAASSAAIYFMYILPITMYFPLPTSLVMGLAVCGMHYIGMYGLVFEMDRNVFDLIKQDSGHASLDLDSLMVVLFTCASANWALLGVSGYLQRQQLQRTADHIEHLATHILTGKLDAEQCSKPVLDETKAEQSLREIGVAVAGFHKYVPSAVVHMMLQGTWSPRPYVEPIEATVFFLDICDFTTHTEDMDPDTLVMHLQELNELCSSIIIEEQGTVDKYMGDCIMALWNAPERIAGHPMCAATAAIRCQYAVGTLPLFRVRIGIQTGEVSAGNVGSKQKLNYTVLGDVVNTASRFEGLNKEYGTTIIAGEATIARLDPERFAWRLLDTVCVKGKRKPKQVYELMGDTRLLNAPAMHQLRILKEAYETANALFCLGQFTEALNNCQAYAGFDPPSRRLCGMIRESKGPRLRAHMVTPEPVFYDPYLSGEDSSLP